jgi:cob(I)alamin adenosyltransferase
MKIYTRRGDAGQTDLFGGARVSKAHSRVLAYGAIDAANSAIGFVCACNDALPVSIRQELLHIMSDLFDLGAELATMPTEKGRALLARELSSQVNAARVTHLEHLIDLVDIRLSPLKTFILPTGSEVSARLHLARSAVRHAEQCMVKLIDEGESVRTEPLAYVNRLSDLLFVWSRLANLEAGIPDHPWVARK